MRLIIFSVFLAGLASAETWNGTVVDVMCKGRDLAGHTLDCALTCAKSGFGIVLADGKFVKFDEGGNARTLRLLNKLKADKTKEKDLKAKVTGSLNGDVIKVESVEIQ